MEVLECLKGLYWGLYVTTGIAVMRPCFVFFIKVPLFKGSLYSILILLVQAPMLDHVRPKPTSLWP